MNRQSGFSMIEILITIAILMVGLLGLAGLQTRLSLAEFEAYQRSQALVIAMDMADRIAANKRNAGKYLGDDFGVGDTYTSCAALTNYERDLCDFRNTLIGAAEKDTSAGTNVGAMLGARACITSPAANEYVVTVAWQGMSILATPKEKCGADAYGDDGNRRTVSTTVRVATLSAT